MSAVSRGVYQKVCEENKRLKRDIEILVGEPYDSKKYVDCHEKWNKFFTDKEEFNIMCRLAAVKYIKNHPEIKIPTL